MTARESSFVSGDWFTIGRSPFRMEILRRIHSGVGRLGQFLKGPGGDRMDRDANCSQFVIFMQGPAPARTRHGFALVVIMFNVRLRLAAALPATSTTLVVEGIERTHTSQSGKEALMTEFLTSRIA